MNGKVNLSSVYAMASDAVQEAGGSDDASHKAGLDAVFAATIDAAAVICERLSTANSQRGYPKSESALAEAATQIREMSTASWEQTG